MSTEQAVKCFTCPRCRSTSGICPECGTEYHFRVGEQFSRCTKTACIEVNAPVDCRCGFVVSEDSLGILTLEMELRPFRHTTHVAVQP